MHDRKQCFMVFNSGRYTYGRAVSIILCGILWWLYSRNVDTIMLCISISTTLVAVICLLYISPILIMDKKGVRLLGFPYPSVIMRWESIRIVGTWSQKVGQEKEHLRFIFFSTDDNPKIKTGEFSAAPRMTKSFIYAVDSTRLRQSLRDNGKLVGLGLVPTVQQENKI